MKQYVKMYGILAIYTASALFFSCSSGFFAVKSTAINIDFSSAARAVMNDAAGEPANNWEKAEFSITENNSVTTRTITNTGSSKLQLNYKAKVGATLQISVKIYKLVNGISTVAFSGTSDPVVVTSGTNNIIIKTINRIIELQIKAVPDLPGETLPDDNSFIWAKAELLVNNSVVQTITNTPVGGEQMPRAVEFNYAAIPGVQFTAAIKMYEQMYEYNELLVTRSGSFELTPAEGTTDVSIPVNQKEFPLVAISHTVDNSFGRWKDLEINASLNGKKYFNYRLNNQANVLDETVSLGFHAPVGATLTISIILFREESFGSKRMRVPVFFKNEYLHSVKLGENTVLLPQNAMEELTMSYVALNLNGKILNISAVPNTVYVEKSNLSDFNGYIFCFKRKDDETLETLGITRKSFTPLPPEDDLEPFYRDTPTTPTPWGFQDTFSGTSAGLTQKFDITVNW